MNWKSLLFSFEGRWLMLLTISLSLATNAMARNLLGPVGNIAIKNPNLIAPASDAFGVATTSGDFDADGVADLVIADREHPKRVQVYRGKVAAIGAPFSQQFHPVEVVAIPTILGTALGPPIVLAAGDFDQGHSDDELVVGVPGDSLNSEGAGAVFVLNRASNGVWSTITTIREGGLYPGNQGPGDHFGASLAIGQFDQNTLDDLAIGIPDEDILSTVDAGVVMIVYGGVAGLYPQDAEVFYRGANGLTGTYQPDEKFGYALAAGDFDGDGVSDLAIGIPGATCAGHPAAGSVLVLRGRNEPGGLSAAGAAYWNQATLGIADSCEDGDRYGTSVAAGRLNRVPLGGTPYDALVVGVPFEQLDGVTAAGAVHVIYGSASGLTAVGNQFLREDTLPGGTLQTSFLGIRVSVVQFASVPSAPRNLVIGMPLQTWNGVSAAGAIWVIDGGNSALDISSARHIGLTAAYQAAPAMPGDTFGAQVTAGDFNGDGTNDLAVGVPGHQIGGDDNTGAVQVIYQSEFIFRHGFE
ncbi:MAG: FG-GAP repeat protein [Dokdonella sp.]